MRRLIAFHLGARDRGTIAYEVLQANGTFDEHQIKTEKGLSTGLIAVLEELKAYAMDICELPEEDVSRVNVKRVAIAFNTNAQRKVVISAERALFHRQGSLVLKAPPVYDHGHPKAEGDNFMDAGLANALNRIEKEAFAYLDGTTERPALLGPESAT